MNFILWLLIIFAACAVASLALCGLAMVLFPKFRSGEHKPGTHRPDMPAGGREIKTIELPLVGGPAFTLAIIGIGVWAGYVFQLNKDQWTMLLIGLSATFGFALIGFLDDWNKVYSKEGLSERVKFGGVFLVSATAAVLYFFLVSTGQESYSFYKDLPILNTLLSNPGCAAETICRVHPGQLAFYGWLIFLVLMTGFVGSFTSVAVDFSDGLDGLAGGLVFSASLALGIVVTGLIDPRHPLGIVFEILALLCAGSTLGYLPWNWPSSWAARHRTAKRSAKIYMGDCGALALGGMMAIIAIFSRNELLLLLLGGAFVLEGLSALIQSRVLTRFFRRSLTTLRFANTDEFVPHTEFPLPFLATPLHHHFDLLGWDRRRLVYGAWALGACFAALGVMSGLSTFTWERYLARILVLILALAIWTSGSWTKCYFVGKHPAERSRRRRLALYYGYPYRIMGVRLYHLVEVIEASENVIETPAEELALWQRMTIYDARSMLGLYCYRAGYYPAALAQWTRIPERNRVLRPEVTRLLFEVDERLALEKQETQPMRRDQLIPQEPILSGNLPPADLPNPHEPIRSDETAGILAGPWESLKPTHSYPINNEELEDLDEDDEEAQIITAPLGSSTHREGEPNGHNGQNGQKSQKLSDASDPSLSGNGAQQTSTPSRWFTRLFRSSSK